MMKVSLTIAALAGLGCMPVELHLHRHADAGEEQGCSLKRKGEACRPPTGPCDLLEVCDGVSAECPADRAPFAAGDPAWCWQSPLPQGEAISSIAGTSSDDVWASAGAAMLHWDGRAWTQKRTDAAGTLRKARALSRSDAWAVGEAGSVLRWNGSDWLQSHPSTNADFLAVWPSAADDVWLSDAQELEHFNGQSWAPVGVQGLRAIHGLAGDDVLGISGNGANALVRWDGERWSAPQPIANVELTGLWRASPDEGWAIGMLGTLVHSTSSGWSAVSAGIDKGMRAVWGSGPQDVWAGGEMTLIHWDGAWSATPPEVAGVLGYGSINGIWGASATDVWAGGDGGLLLHWDGKTWRQVSSDQGLNSGSIRSLSALASNDAWAAGDRGVQHFDGTGWSFPRGVPPQHHLGIWAAGPNAVFAVGIQSLSRFDGQEWTVDFIQTASFIAVHGLSSSDVWAVGDAGAVAHWDGSQWSHDKVGAQALRSVRALGESAVWVVGRSGAARLWNGKEWEDHSTGSEELLSVWGSAPNDVYVAGPANALLHWDGGQWNKIPMPRTFSAVSGTGAADVWACGGGVVAHWDGKAWTTSRLTRTSGDLLTVWAGPFDVWVAGEQNTILHRAR